MKRTYVLWSFGGNTTVVRSKQNPMVTVKACQVYPQDSFNELITYKMNPFVVTVTSVELHIYIQCTYILYCYLPKGAFQEQ